MSVSGIFVSSSGEAVPFPEPLPLVAMTVPLELEEADPEEPFSSLPEIP